MELEQNLLRKVAKKIKGQTFTEENIKETEEKFNFKFPGWYRFMLKEFAIFEEPFTYKDPETEELHTARLSRPSWMLKHLAFSYLLEVKRIPIGLCRSGEKLLLLNMLNENLEALPFKEKYDESSTELLFYLCKDFNIFLHLIKK